MQHPEESQMAGYGKGKSSKGGGFVGNLAKLGGSSKKLNLKSDMKPEGAITGLKKGAKQAHKKV
jgi:hypothetical protein